MRPGKWFNLGTGSNMQAAGRGMELAAAVGGACLLGYWIDFQFGTGPWGLVVCACLGVVGGLYNLVREGLRQSFRVNDVKKPKLGDRKQDNGA